MTEPAAGANPPRLHEVTADSLADLRRRGFQIGAWRVEPTRNRIVSSRVERRLDPRVMEVLVHLASRAGQVVSRDELIDAVWKDTFVSENSVSQAVSRLRKMLGDDTQRPIYIETISKSGYRLLAEVSRHGEPEAVPGPAPAKTESPFDERGTVPDRNMWSRPAAVASLFVVFMAAGVIGAWFLSGPGAPRTRGVPRIVPELTLTGTQFEPVLSPQGDQVAFCWQGAEQSDWSLYVKSVGADNPVRLTDDAANERLPAWSPDGRSIAYISYSVEEDSCGIYRRAVLGGPAEHLADCAPGIRALSWSPDGRILAMSLRDSTQDPLRIELLDLESGTTRALTIPPAGSIGDQAPVFSPDGHSIAFERRRTGWRHDVMVVAASGGMPHRLTNDEWGQLRGVHWRSDGEAVIFSSNRTGRFSLWQVPAAGGEPVRLPIDDTWITQPSVARSGGRLIYRTFRDVVDIWSLPLGPDGLSGGEPVRQVASTRSERQPVWSPTGDAIAFVSDRSGTTELWSGRPDGTDLMRHTEMAGPLPGSPAWSPDGTRIVFDAAADGHSDLWMVNADSRRPEKFTSDPSDERNGTFSRDGQWIYFASDRSGTWQIWRMPETGGNALAVTDGGGFLAQESIDGNWLYHVKLNEPGIWRIPTVGGEEELILADLDLSDWGSWTVGETGIYFVSRNPTAIKILDPESGAIRDVFSPDRQLPYLGRVLSLSADGRSLLFSMIDHSDDEVMRVDLAGL